MGDNGGEMPTCREVLEFLDDYREGRLPPVERQRFTAHLAACPDCVAYLDSYERTIGLVNAALAAPDEEVPAEVPAELVAAILASRGAG
jgi:anti-sigma factor RsiW